MYGMVNRAVEMFVCTKIGENDWLEIRRMAGLGDEPFLSLEPYPDRMTVELVIAISKHIHKPSEVVLEDFGYYWIEFAESQGYADLIRLAGTTFPEVLKNLNNLHSRVQLSFKNLKPPEFWCSEIGDKSVIVHYRSHRDGLAPFVVGLLKGLAAKFGLSAMVEHSIKKSDGHDHDQFSLIF